MKLEQETLRTLAHQPSKILTSKTSKFLGIFAISLALMSCGGGGGGGSSSTTGATPPSSGAGGGGSSSDDLRGIAPLSGIAGFLTTGGSDSLGFSMSVRAFDEASNEPVTISKLNDLAIRLTTDTGEVTLLNFSDARNGSCSRSTSNQSSEAILLFDRSGSIDTNDPSGATLEAGVEFANLLASPDTAAVAAFSTTISGDIEYLTSGFTSSSSAVTTAIRSIRPAGGLTPLWTAMQSAIESGGFPDQGQRKALITFSDGENTESGSSTSVLRSAINNNVKLFSVSLENFNSRELDQLSLATDGLAWSTTDATRVAAFAKSLSKVLDGDFVDCSIGVNVTATAENYAQEDVIIGPARFIKPDFSFDYNLNGNSGTAENSIIIPFTAGRKIGSTSRARFGTSDLLSVSNSNSCVVQKPQCGATRFVNNCTRSVTARICSENGDCSSKVLPAAIAGEPRVAAIFPNVSGRITTAVCPNLDNAIFQPIALSGASPNLTAIPSGFEETFNCLYSERVPVEQRPDQFFQTDRDCR